VPDSSLFAELAHVVTLSLASGKSVEVEGLGVFYLDPFLGVCFEDCPGPSVFIAYAKEDMEAALRLHDALRQAGFRPWIDVRALLPGQNWPRAIEMAIQNADFFVACFSQRAVVKRGGFQAEIRYALDCARSLPLDDILHRALAFGRLPRAAHRGAPVPVHRRVPRLADGPRPPDRNDSRRSEPPAGSAVSAFRRVDFRLSDSCLATPPRASLNSCGRE